MAWVDTRTLIVQRLERVLTVRDPAQPNELRRIITCFQLDSNMVYPGQLDAEVRAEIVIARRAFDLTAEKADPRTLDAMARHLATHLRTQPKTEWRHVVLAAEKQIEAARRGEIVAVVAEEDAKPEWIIGRPAPDFVAHVDRQSSFRLADCRGRPTIIGVYQSLFGIEAYNALRELSSVVSDKAVIVAVDQTSSCGLEPILDEPNVLKKDADPGTSRCIWCLYGGRIASLRDGPTPRFILIDERGIVRQIIEGYGAEVPSLLRRFVESAGPVKAAGHAEFDGRK